MLAIFFIMYFVYNFYNNNNNIINAIYSDHCYIILFVELIYRSTQN